MSLLALLALPPDHPWRSAALLAHLVVTLELVRVLATPAAPRSRAVHALVTGLSMPVPGFGLGLLLVYAAWVHPEQAWWNLGHAAWAYAVWALTGAATRAVRSDAEGADFGFLFLAAAVTFGFGVAAALALGP